MQNQAMDERDGDEANELALIRKLNGVRNQCKSLLDRKHNVVESKAHILLRLEQMMEETQKIESSQSTEDEMQREINRLKHENSRNLRISKVRHLKLNEALIRMDAMETALNVQQKENRGLRRQCDVMKSKLMQKLQAKDGAKESDLDELDDDENKVGALNQDSDQYVERMQQEAAVLMNKVKEAMTAMASDQNEEELKVAQQRYTGMIRDARRKKAEIIESQKNKKSNHQIPDVPPEIQKSLEAMMDRRKNKLRPNDIGDIEPRIERRLSPELLRVAGKEKTVEMEKVKMGMHSLSADGVFILDANCKIYQFNGAKSDEWDKEKANVIIKQMQKRRSLKQEDVAIIRGLQDNGTAADDFWAFLLTHTEHPQTREKTLNYS